jgi:hypothetical protein
VRRSSCRFTPLPLRLPPCGRRPPPPPPPPPPPRALISGASSGTEHAQTLREVDPTGGDTLETAPFLTIRQWIDPVVDERGHDPRSRYVEIFWLGVLGPTATWLLRRLASGLEVEPDGYELDLQVTAASMGLKFSPGRSSPFSRALQRCVMFGMAHPLPGGGLAVRRRIPPVGHRHLRRMPEQLQLEHAGWQLNAGSSDKSEEAFARAHQLAMAMLDVGDDRNVIEHQLRAIGVVSNVAAQVADNVAQLD